MHNKLNVNRTAPQARLKPWFIALAVLVCGVLLGPAAGTTLGATGSSGNVPLIQVLVSTPDDSHQEALRGFRSHLVEKLGPEGERFRLAVHVMETGDAGEVKPPELERSSLIFSLGAPATRFAKSVTGKRPVVFSMVADPVQEGILGQGSFPTLTGVTTELALEDQLDALTRVLPHARRIGVLHHVADTPRLEQVREEAAALGLELVGVAVESNEQVLGALEQLSVQIDVLWTFGRLLRSSSSLAQFLILHTLRNELPFMGLSPSHVQKGALFCAYASPEDLGRQSAELVIDLLSGKKVRQLPPQTPRVTRIAINLTAADALGQAIPRKIRKSAAPVF